MTDKLIDRIKAYNSAPTIYDAPDPVEMAKRILADADVIERWRSMWEKEQSHNEQLIEALKAADDRIEALVAAERDDLVKAHRQGYAQGGAAGETLRKAMVDRIEELEAENRKTRRETLRDHTLSEVLSAATVSELVAEIRRRDNPPKTDVKPRQLMEDQSDD